MSRVHLTGLTKEQCEMLDIMWELDTREKFLEFIDMLPADKFNMVMTLQEMVIQEMAEKNSDTDPSLGNKMLTSIGVKL